ncbi:hypothetical protein BX616_002326 [Lobosporangium transversale]|nr:hypothetical protein BX616_002326 [Lobosporangium transversale]
MWEWKITLLNFAQFPSYLASLVATLMKAIISSPTSGSTALRFCISMSTNYDHELVDATGDVYLFQINGAAVHRIGPLLASDNQPAQIYYFDHEDLYRRSLTGAHLIHLKGTSFAVDNSWIVSYNLYL